MESNLSGGMKFASNQPASHDGVKLGARVALASNAYTHAEKRRCLVSGAVEPLFGFWSGAAAVWCLERLSRCVVSGAVQPLLGVWSGPAAV